MPRSDILVDFDFSSVEMRILAGIADPREARTRSMSAHFGLMYGVPARRLGVGRDFTTIPTPSGRLREINFLTNPCGESLMTQSQRCVLGVNDPYPITRIRLLMGVD